MKKLNVILVIVIAVLCLFGWSSLISQPIETNVNYKTYMKEADALVEQRLYQRAILKYEDALKEKSSEEVYLKINEAYKLRYAEEPEKTYEDYYDFLAQAVIQCPSNESILDAYIEFCKKEEDYEEMYDCLINAKANGYDAKKADELLLIAKYAFTYKGSERSGIRQSIGEYYTVSRENEWGVYTIEDGTIIPTDYKMIGLCDEDGTAVYTSNDSRLINIDGMVLGIFEEIITDAGVLSEGLIPACSNGVYNFYDEYGKKVFGGFEMAGMFQDGKAAVKKDGHWMFIDKEGNAVSDKYQEIVLDYAGRYIVNDTVLLSKKEGQYEICDENFKTHGAIQGNDIDIYTEDGIIAYCRDGKWGFVDADGEILIQPEYDKAKSFSNGVAGVCKNGKWGFIDKTGTLVIDYQFSDVGYMQDEGMCPIRIDFPDEVSQMDEKYLENWNLLKLYIGIVEN